MRRRDEATPKPKKPTLAEQYAAQVAARGGYKPLTGKSTGEYLQPDTNMYNAGPMDVLRGINNMVGRAGDFLVVEPAKSLGRTLSTRNIQTVFNPKSSWEERANALAEDAFNVASLVPTFKGAAAAADAASMARYYNRLPAIHAEQRAAWDAYEGAAKEAYDKAAKQLPGTRLMSPSGKPGPLVPAKPPRQVLDELDQMRPRYPKPPAVKPTRYELAKQKADELNRVSRLYVGRETIIEPPDIPDPTVPNIYRGWHTNMEGLPLPQRLNPWEDYIGVEQAVERRGSSPQGNILTSGLYNTDDRLISGRYIDSLPSYKEPMGYKPTGSYLPLEKVYSQYNLDDFVDINTPISQIDELKGLIENTVKDPYSLSNDGPFLTREATRISKYPYVPQKNDVVIDAEDLNVSKWNFRGKNPEEITILDLLNAAPNEQAARSIVMALKKPVAATSTVRTRYPLFRNPGNVPSKIAYGSEDMPSMLIESSPSPDNFEPARSVVYSIGDKTFKLTPNRYRRTENSPFGTHVFPTNTTFDREVTTTGWPGQNYFDLPTKRNPSTGEIEEIAGMKALDLGRFSQKKRREVADATRKWFDGLGAERLSPQDKDMLDDAIDRILYGARGGDERFDFYQFRQGLGEIESIYHTLTGSTAGQDMFFKMLKDDLGYEAIPHGGGMMVGGSSTPTHQAIVFNSPEKLPPSTYVPPPPMRSSNDIAAEAMNEYLKALATTRLYQPGKRLGRDFSNRMDQRMLNMAKRASISPISSYAQNLAGNR